jgi:glycosyltransferase involved in cell wall biosynthesis
MILSYFFKRKIFWFKYAGSWVDKASKFYEFQREVLKKLANNCKITINGDWYNKNSNILAFENPCINYEDRIQGKQVVEKKTIGPKINFCFVGALNRAKGVDLILEVLRDFSHKNKIGTFYFVGGGKQLNKYKEIASKLSVDIQFIGFQPKIKVNEILKICHFIVLPSEAEGFPKVISEGMNFGCAPIVSNISAIGQYVKHNKNGFLLDEIDATYLNVNIMNAMKLSINDYKKMLDINYKLSTLFTYSSYIKKMNEQIFLINSGI